ncbi:MAG TPA: hypothetical protein VGJ93_07930 [Desulfuromonadaceae bacterium]|jgi:hypothetical protein
MEAVMIAGLAVVAVGGYFSVLDFLDNLGIKVKDSRQEKCRSAILRTGINPAQGRVKKMSGVNI